MKCSECGGRGGSINWIVGSETHEICNRCYGSGLEPCVECNDIEFIEDPSGRRDEYGEIDWIPCPLLCGERYK